MKKIFILLLTIVTFLNLSGCLKTTHSKTETTSKETTTERIIEDNLEFKKFVNGFILELVDDPSTINQLFKDPSIIGYARDIEEKASYQIYESYVADQESDYEFLTETITELEKYDKSSLNASQQMEYDVISDICDVEMLSCKPDTEWYILTYSFIDKYGGNAANVPNDIENYEINDEQDIVDIIDYLDSTVPAFRSYDKYLSDRVELGFEFSDYTLDSMIEYLDGVVNHKDDYYLVRILDEKISSLTFLDNEKKALYIEETKRAINESFMSACMELSSICRKYKGYWTGEDESYINHYGNKCNGFMEYEALSVIGYDESYMDVLAQYENAYYYSYLSYSAVYSSVSKKSGSLDKVESIISNKESFLGATSIDGLVEILLDKSKSVVKPLENMPIVKTKLCDETIQEFAEYSAYYVLSAFDEKNSKVESITVNPSSFDSLGDAIFTLAHEGYPGHLYSHSYQKESDVPMLVFGFSRNGVNEAWAQYAAYKTLMNASETTENEYEKYALKLIASDTFLNYVYSGYLDYVVNFLGYGIDDLIEEGFAADEDDAIELIHFCDENPGTFIGYGLLFYSMVKDHSNLKNSIKSYNEQDFNSYLIKNGGLYNLDMYRKAIDKYIEINS